MNFQNLKIVFLLHLLLMIYSLSGFFCKLASNEVFLSVRFCVCYGLVIGIMGVYAIGWQQVIKRLPLTVAFANKAITVIWGIIWGAIFFKEPITSGKLFGAILIVAGVVTFAKADGEEK